jgi:HSP20 family protein
MANLIPWGMKEVERLKGEIDRLFDDFLKRSSFAYSFERRNWMPALDVSENGKEIIVRAEIPGMDVKDVHISLKGKLLTIKGERKQEREEEEKNHHSIEPRHGFFSRSLELSADVDSDRVKAEYTDGVLKLNLPKAEEQSFKKIEVRTS